jgi:N-acetylglutamate synthase-like GNAT family acetyltransferase
MVSQTAPGGVWNHGGMDVRPYQPSDRDACLAVFDSLALPDLRTAYEAFLETPGLYVVMEHESKVVGCGGYSEPDADGVGRMHWGMVHRDAQRQGLGRFLLMYRMREMSRLGQVRMASIETTPASQGFYEKQGFRVAQAAGDWVVLLRKLAVCG